MIKWSLSIMQAPNISRFFWTILFEFVREYKQGNDFWIIAEPKEILPTFAREFPGCKPVLLETHGDRGEYYDIDLNILQTYEKQFDVVFSQALLEHVCRPSIVLENFARATKPGGIIVLHTHLPGRDFHQYPVDCVRFYKDFFTEMQKYLPIKLLEYVEHSPEYKHPQKSPHHLFVAYRKI